MKTLQEQSEIVKMRLEYHFGTGIDNRWRIPKDMPFMKEFLNEVERLCALSDVVGRREHLCQHDRSVTNRVCDDCGATITYVPG